MTAIEPCRILDAHVHQWDVRHNARQQRPLVKLFGWRPPLMHKVARSLFPQPVIDFVGKPDHMLGDYLPEHLARDWGRFSNRMDGFIHVEPGWQWKKHTDLANETAWLESLDPDVEVLEAIVGQIVLERDDLDAALDAHEAASGRFVGVRQPLAASSDPGVMSHASSPGLMDDANWRRGFRRLGERGLTFDAWVYHHQLPLLARLVEDIPDTPVVLDHLGSPVAIGGPFGGVGQTAAARDQIESEWKAGIERLAATEHVRFKVSGMLMPISGFGLERWPAPMSQREFVERVGPMITWFIDTVGIERCMWASNFPMDSVSIEYESLLGGIEALVAGHTPAQLAAFFAGNARDFYGIEVTDE